ncbi:hypothetical protein MIR68_004801 [Amoeboaphelidium protococcarum]|nr:hypothetical protein MIR68_004801 [Amoeboaphelidium protococcarum]
MESQFNYALRKIFTVAGKQAYQKVVQNSTRPNKEEVETLQSCLKTIHPFSQCPQSVISTVSYFFRISEYSQDEAVSLNAFGIILQGEVGVFISDDKCVSILKPLNFIGLSELMQLSQQTNSQVSLQSSYYNYRAVTEVCRVAYLKSEELQAACSKVMLKFLVNAYSQYAPDLQRAVQICHEIEILKQKGKLKDFDMPSEDLRGCCTVISLKAGDVIPISNKKDNFCLLNGTADVLIKRNAGDIFSVQLQIVPSKLMNLLSLLSDKKADYQIKVVVQSNCRIMRWDERKLDSLIQENFFNTKLKQDLIVQFTLQIIQEQQCQDVRESQSAVLIGSELPQMDYPYRGCGYERVLLKNELLDLSVGSCIVLSGRLQDTKSNVIHETKAVLQFPINVQCIDPKCSIVVIPFIPTHLAANDKQAENVNQMSSLLQQVRPDNKAEYQDIKNLFLSWSLMKGCSPNIYGQIVNQVYDIRFNPEEFYQFNQEEQVVIYVQHGQFALSNVQKDFNFKLLQSGDVIGNIGNGSINQLALRALSQSQAYILTLDALQMLPNEVQSRLRLLVDSSTSIFKNERILAVASNAFHRGIYSSRHLQSLQQLRNQKCSISHLPGHVMRDVFKYLKKQSLLQCRQVCKDWRDLLRTDGCDIQRLKFNKKSNFTLSRYISMLQIASKSLRDVSFTSCAVNYSHIKLLHAICPNVIHLSIKGCGFAARHDSKFINYITQCMTQLETLHLSKIRKINYDQMLLKNLQSFKLSNATGIIQKDLKDLSTNAPLLTELALCKGQSIDDECVKIISQNMRLLATLDLSWCQLLTDVSCQYISSLVNLKHLNLAHCELLTDCGSAELSKSCLKLRSLDLSVNSQISDLSIVMIIDNISEIEYLRLRTCPRLTIGWVKLVFDNCQYIKQLVFTGCKLINPQNVRNMFKDRNVDIVCHLRSSTSKKDQSGGRKLNRAQFTRVHDRYQMSPRLVENLERDRTIRFPSSDKDSDKDSLL